MAYHVRLCMIRGIYCIEPLGQIYRSTWLGGQVASLKIRKVIPGL